MEHKDQSNLPSAPSIHCLQPGQIEISSVDIATLASAADCLLFEANYHFAMSKYEKALELASICYLLNPTSKTKALELMDRCTGKISVTQSRPMSSIKVSGPSSNNSIFEQPPNRTSVSIADAPPITGLPLHGHFYAEAPPTATLTKSEDDIVAEHFLRSEDLFDMLTCKPWCPIEEIEKAHKRAIVSVHSDRNHSRLATEATAKLMEEIKKFRASPSSYTKEMEQKRANRGIRDPPTDMLFDRDGYGRSLLPESFGKETIDPLSGFDRDGKRPYTWFAAAGPKRHVDCNPEMGAEATKPSALFADPRGEQAWMARIEYNDETAHKFSKSGKYQTFSDKGVSASKNGTKFIAKNK